MEALKQRIEFLAEAGIDGDSVYKLTNAILGNGELDNASPEGRMANVYCDTLSRWADARERLVSANEEEQRNAQRMVDSIKNHQNNTWGIDTRRVNELLAECAKLEDMLVHFGYIIGNDRETTTKIFRMASEATFPESK
jgi:hypothetical protein